MQHWKIHEVAAASSYLRPTLNHGLQLSIRYSKRDTSRLFRSPPKGLNAETVCTRRFNFNICTRGEEGRKNNACIFTSSAQL